MVILDDVEHPLLLLELNVLSVLITAEHAQHEQNGYPIKLTSKVVAEKIFKIYFVNGRKIRF